MFLTQDIFNNIEQDFRQTFKTVFMAQVIDGNKRYFDYPSI